MQFEFNPQVTILLEGNSDEKVMMRYREHCWTMPKVAERPPYFTNPKYNWNYPLI